MIAIIINYIATTGFLKRLVHAYRLIIIDLHDEMTAIGHCVLGLAILITYVVSHPSNLSSSVGKTLVS